MNIGRSTPVDIQYTGTYTIEMDVATVVVTGAFQTTTGTGEFINHYFVVTDNWKQISFMIPDTDLRQAVRSGNMIKI